MTGLERVHHSWKPLLNQLNTDFFLHFKNEILTQAPYHPKNNVLKVFETPVYDIKVVVLGKEPHYFPNKANGLAYAINPSFLFTPELENIFIESKTLVEDLAEWGTLEHWQKQGVFLLNTSLTVETMVEESHIEYWEEFIKKVIYFIAIKRPCIWLFWGQELSRFTANLPVKSSFYVKNYNDITIKMIPANEDYNYVLESYYPSEKKFLGCKHFNYTNIILQKLNKKIINW
jgi:uracil-DNA glycosylase